MGPGFDLAGQIKENNQTEATSDDLGYFAVSLKAVQICSIGMDGCTFRDSESGVFIFASLLVGDQLLGRGICS